MIASQDRALQEYLRKKPGQPIMYLHKKTPVLEQPCELSRKAVEFNMNKAFTFGTADEKKLNVIKKSEGLPVADTTDVAIAKKKKKKKQPNPLSCKKKKKKSSSSANTSSATTNNRDGIQNKTIEKKKRKRIHIPSHVKEVLNKTGSS